MLSECLIQVLCSLVRLQRAAHFVHRDLTTLNVLVHSVSPAYAALRNAKLHYGVVLEDNNGHQQNWRFETSSEVVCKLNDFGFSQIDQPPPTASMSPQQQQQQRQRSLGVSGSFWNGVEYDADPARGFDPSVDVHTLGCGLFCAIVLALSSNFDTPVADGPEDWVFPLIDYMIAPWQLYPQKSAAFAAKRSKVAATLKQLYQIRLRQRTIGSSTQPWSDISLALSKTELLESVTAASELRHEYGDAQMARATAAGVLHHFSQGRFTPLRGTEMTVLMGTMRDNDRVMMNDTIVGLPFGEKLMFYVPSTLEGTPHGGGDSRPVTTTGTNQPPARRRAKDTPAAVPKTQVSGENLNVF